MVYLNITPEIWGQPNSDTPLVAHSPCSKSSDCGGEWFSSPPAAGSSTQVNKRDCSDNEV